MTPYVLSATRRLALSTFFAAAVLPRPAAAMLVRDDLSVADYTAQAAASPFNATGGFWIGSTFDSSGVLVAPNVVLGASHATAAGSAATRTFLLGGVSYGVASVVRLDGNTNAEDGRDVALFTLTAPVAGVAPATLYAGTPQALVGHEAVYTGLGDQGTGSSGPTTVDGVLLAGTNVIDAAGLTVTDNSGTTTTLPDSIVFADFDNPLDAGDNGLGSAAATPFETQVTIGDSGGGLFVLNTATGVFELAALHSLALGATNAIEYGSLSGSTTFAPADLATIQAAIPEPATAALLAVAVSLLPVRRRRRS